MTDIIDEKLYNLVEVFLPEYKAYDDFYGDINRLYLVRNKSTERVLKEMLIHKESIEKKEIKALGFDELVMKLEGYDEEFISIVCGNSKKYSFEVFLNEELSKRVGYVIIKNRVKTQEELSWEKSLGIQHRD